MISDEQTSVELLNAHVPEVGFRGGAHGLDKVAEDAFAREGVPASDVACLFWVSLMVQFRLISDEQFRTSNFGRGMFVLGFPDGAHGLDKVAEDAFAREGVPASTVSLSNVLENLHQCRIKPLVTSR